MTSPIASAIRNVVTRGLTAVAAFTRAGLAAPAQAHPDLSGLLAPMTGERTLEGLEVQGTIPPELDGR